MIAPFALRLICGMSWMWLAMPRREVTCGFFRIQMLLVLGLSVLAALTGDFPSVGAAASADLSRTVTLVSIVMLAVASFCGSIAWKLERRTAGNALVFTVAGLAAATLVLIVAQSGSVSEGRVSAESATLAPLLHRLGSECVSALLLGGAVTGMLLGHWYLTAPTMSISPLGRLNAYFGAAAVLRLMFSAAALLTAWDRIAGPTQGTWLALRWMAGILGPLVVTAMVWRILKYRNTQAATGVLFVGVILVFIGDLTAELLRRELGAPL